MKKTLLLLMLVGLTAIILKNIFIDELNQNGIYLKVSINNENREKVLLENTKRVLEKRLEAMGLYNTLFDVFRTEKTSIKISEEKFIEIMIPKLCKKCSEDKVKKILSSIGYFSVMSINEDDKIDENSIPIIDSNFLKKVSLIFKDKEPQLNIQLNNEGAKILADYTAINILKKIAIVIDDKIYAMPRITQEIANGSFVIGFEEMETQEMYDLVLVLNSGVLASEIRIVELSSIISNKI